MVIVWGTQIRQKIFNENKYLFPNSYIIIRSKSSTKPLSLNSINLGSNFNRILAKKL